MESARYWFGLISLTSISFRWGCSDFRNAQRYKCRYCLFSRALSGLWCLSYIFILECHAKIKIFLCSFDCNCFMVGHIESGKNLRINQPILENIKYQFWTRWTSPLVDRNSYVDWPDWVKCLRLVKIYSNEVFQACTFVLSFACLWASEIPIAPHSESILPGWGSIFLMTILCRFLHASINLNDINDI